MIKKNLEKFERESFEQLTALEVVAEMMEKELVAKLAAVRNYIHRLDDARQALRSAESIGIPTDGDPEYINETVKALQERLEKEDTDEKPRMRADDGAYEEDWGRRRPV